MKFFDIKNKNVIIILTALIIGSMSVWYALAGATTNVKGESGYAWSENGGWLNFASDDGGVMVYDDYLSGYAWSENLGWISLNCINTNSCEVSDYKITNDKEGNLSGYAWGENIGWINFAPDNGGVKINSNGEFSGYAWGENIGWISFNCQDLDVCQNSDFKVASTWLPLSVREQNYQDSLEGLEIYDVKFSSTDTMIVVNWKTTDNANSHIRWGTDRDLKKEKDQDDKEKNHRMVIHELTPETQYFFRLRSTDRNGQSDTSRIWDISTKKSSAIFNSRQWKSYEENKTEPESEEDKYEKVEIDISDKKEDENIKDIKEIVKEPEISQNNDEEAEKGPSAIARGFAFVKNSLSSVFSGVYDSLMGGQKYIAKIFRSSGDKFSDISGAVKSKFAKNEISQKSGDKTSNLFTTLVFKKDDRKFLAEVKFKIIDKEDRPISNLKTTLFSDPQESTTDDNGVASFKNVPIGVHTLAFNHQGEELKKKVAIADTLTDEGKVLAEIVQVKAQKEKIATWMWVIIISLIIMTGTAIYFGISYYKLKKVREE